MMNGALIPEERQLFLAMRELNQSRAENAVLCGANIKCIQKVSNDPDSLKITPLDSLMKTLLELEDELQTALLLCHNADTASLGQIQIKPLLEKKKRAMSLLKWMLDKNANPEGGGLSTPLHHAVSNGIYDPEIVSLLLTHQANPNAKEQDFYGYTPLHIMCGGMYILARNYKVPSTTVLDLLVQAGADVNAKDKKGRTPLRLMTLVLNHAEYYAERIELLKAFVQRGADLTIQDNEGISAFSFIEAQIGESRKNPTNLRASPSYVPNMSMMQNMTISASKSEPATVEPPKSPLPRRKSTLMKKS